MKFELKYNGRTLEFVKTHNVWVCAISDFDASVLIPYATETDTDVKDLFLDSHVDVLELSRRAANCLKAENIRTLRDLVNTEANYIRHSIPNLGATTYIEIVKALALHGLTLKGKLR